MKHWRHARLILTFSALALGGIAAGCGGSDGGGGACQTEFSAVTLWGKCTSCHASTVTGTARMDAPAGVDYDKYETAKPHAASAMLYVMTNLMPPPPMPPATDAEKASLQAWVACETK